VFSSLKAWRESGFLSSYSASLGVEFGEFGFGVEFGFGPFGADDDNVFYCHSYVTSITS